MANKLTEVRFVQKYTAAQLLEYFTNKNFPDDWTDGMFLLDKENPNRIYYFAKKTENGQTTMGMTVVGEENAVTSIRIQNGSQLTGTVNITRNGLDVYSRKEVDDAIRHQASKVYKPKGSIGSYEELLALPESDVESGDVYNVLTADGKDGVNYAAVEGYAFQVNGKTFERFGFVKDRYGVEHPITHDDYVKYLSDYRGDLTPAAYGEMAGIRDAVRFVLYSDAATTFETDIILLDYGVVDYALSGDSRLSPIDVETGRVVFVVSESDTRLMTKHRHITWDSLAGIFDTSGLATKQEFEDFVADANKFYEDIQTKLNEILQKYDERHTTAVAELSERLEAINSNFGAQIPGGIPKIGNQENGWMLDDYIVTTDGSGNIVAVYRYGDAASKNTGLTSGSLPLMKETVTKAKYDSGRYPAIYKSGGLGTADSPLGMAAFCDITSSIPDLTSGDSSKIPVAGAVNYYVQQQIAGVQEKLVNVLVQQDKQFANKTALEEYVGSHLSSIKSGFVYNVLDTDMNYAVRKQTVKHIRFATLSASFSEDKMYEYNVFGSWLNGVPGSGREIGTVVVSQFYQDGYDAEDGNGEPLNVYAMKSADDPSKCYLFVMNENYGTYWLTHYHDEVFAVQSIQGRAAVDMTETLFTLDPLGAEFDPKTLGTASTKDYGTTTGKLPVIGSPLSGKSGYPVLLNAKGELVPGSSMIAGAAYKAVDASISDSSTNLPTSKAVYDFTSDLRDVSRRVSNILLVNTSGNDFISHISEWEQYYDRDADHFDIPGLADTYVAGMLFPASYIQLIGDGAPKHCFTLIGGVAFPTKCVVGNDDAPYVGLTIYTEGSIAGLTNYHVIHVKAYFEETEGVLAWTGRFVFSFSGAYITAKKLEQTRTINGLNFDGTQSVNSYFVEANHQTSDYAEQKNINANFRIQVVDGARITVRFTTETERDSVGLKIANCNYTNVVPILQGGKNIGQRLEADVYDLVYDSNGAGANQPAWLVVSGGGGGKIYWER